VIIQNSPAIKKVCSPEEGHCEKRCEIQGGNQENGYFKNDNSGEFVLPFPCFTII